MVCISLKLFIKLLTRPTSRYIRGGLVANVVPTVIIEDQDVTERGKKDKEDEKQCTITVTNKRS